MDGVTRADTSGLDRLYATHAPSAIRLPYLLTGDRHLAEDLVQDAFVRVAGRFQHLRDPESFEAYLRRIVVNLSRGYFRRLRVERKYLSREESRRTFSYVDPPDIEERDALWGALHHLPYRQRAAVVLRYYQDLSEQQVGEVLGCSAQAAKSLLARGMEALRVQLRDEKREQR